MAQSYIRQPAAKYVAKAKPAETVASADPTLVARASDARATVKLSGKTREVTAGPIQCEEYMPQRFRVLTAAASNGCTQERRRLTI